MLAIYFSPMLLGLLLLLAIAVSATALWYVSRSYAGPAFWMAAGWVLILGVVLFIGFMVTGNPVLNVLGNAGQLAGEALFLLGIFRFMGRPLPLWIVPASVGIMVAFNVHYWMFDGNSDFLMGVYSTIAGLLPLQAIWLLLCTRDGQTARAAQLLVGLSLLLYSAVTLLRGYYGYHDWLLDRPYIPPQQSFSYLLPYNFALPALVMGFVGVTLMTMQRILAVSRDHEARAQHLATLDELTGLLNRRAFNAIADRDLAHALRHQRSLCLAMIDLDHFKRLNDSYGHSFGDQVLRAFAEGCKAQLRSSDVLARYGGEEFVLLLPDTEPGEARIMLDRARSAVAATDFGAGTTPVALTFSAGLAQARAGDHIDSLLGRADKALYRAKAAGRDRVVLWQPD
ncbi:MAG: GGDEF domain-containing protein [Haliea sp.]|uniref:GGDEF domain-containing protein n=1 Tax=Haliea sp. TaxID=1932666 RepID=UPI0032EFC9EF